MMVADIATGDTTAADIAFLVGLILAALAGLLGFVGPSTLPENNRRIPIGWLAVAAIALGLLLL